MGKINYYNYNMSDNREICELDHRLIEAAIKHKPEIVFVLGGPGSGKGTQCEKLSQEYGFMHISVGDILRDELNRRTHLGEQIKSTMEQGEMVPITIIASLLVKTIFAKKSKKYLIDGFPRTLEQVIYFEKNIQECSCIL